MLLQDADHMMPDDSRLRVGGNNGSAEALDQLG